MATTNSTGSGRVAVLIPAAGAGKRMGTAGNKTLLNLGGLSVIERSAGIFLDHPRIDRIVIAAQPRDIPVYKKIFAAYEGNWKIGTLINGGTVRQDSVWRGISAMEGDPPDWVLVHDGVRPCCSRELLDRVLAALDKHSAVVPVLPVVDTMRRIDDGAAGFVLNREGLYRTQTPQGFHWSVLREAFVKARKAKFLGTDDAQLVETVGGRVHSVRGEERNIKITTPDDLLFAQWVCERTDREDAG